MDELCRIHSSFDQLKNGQIIDDDDDDDVMGGSGIGSDMLDILKHQIANHPLYPNLVSAYIECRKIGAPTEMASLLEEISKEGHHVTSPYEVGVDPELDQFMETYCEALVRYKEMLLKPLDESTTFFSNIVSQLNDLCKDHKTSTTTTTTSSFNYTNYHSDDGAGGSSDEEIMYDHVEANNQESSWGGGGGGADENELKEMLMKKYSGYLSTLRKEFLKKRKKGKLPKNARSALLDWWNTHYRWPYPTEEEKNKLSEMSGLDQKQINNWFINQRKRHWKPSEDMRFALMQGGSFASSS